MQALTILAIIAATTTSYLAEIKLAPSFVKFIPELLSVVAVLGVVFIGIRTRFHLIRPAYWLLLASLAIVIICGIAANAVAPGPIIGGMRYMLRAIPFFLLPLVYPFSDRQIKQILKVLCGIAIIQLPIAAYQRYALLQESRFTGDYVYGTVMLSPTLTIFMLTCISVLIALTVRNHVPKTTAAALFVLFLIPTTINETKITVFLFPMVVLMTMFLVTPRGQRMRMLSTAVLLLIVAAGIFAPIYNYLGKQNVGDKEQITITDMFTQRDFFSKYLNRETEIGSTEEVGRVDAFLVPVRFVARDPVLAAFGVGIGNASISSLGNQFSGYYSATLGPYTSGASSAGSLLLEVGWLGLLLVWSIHWLVFKDGLAVARTFPLDLTGCICVAWPAVVVMYTMTFFYTAPISSETLSYVFWLGSGFVAARRSISGPNVRLSSTRRVAANQVPT